MLLNMGQLLSIPFVIVGLLCIFNRKLMERLGTEKQISKDKKSE